MAKKDRMRERILRHGLDLKRAFFPDPYSGIGPVELCKKLHRLEARAHRAATDHCNGDIECDEMEKIELSVIRSLANIIPDYKEKWVSHIFVNLDPRGYALKIKSESVLDLKLDIYRDWGGYGILAPTFDGEA